jgi:integrase
MRKSLLDERMSLTDANVADLKPKAKVFAAWDDGKRAVPGLCVRVQTSGKKSYYLRYSLRGLFWYRIGPASMFATDARIEARKLIGEIARGVNPQRERTARRQEGLTFEQLHEQYLEQKAKVHHKSWKQGAYLLRRFALPSLGKRKVTEIRFDDVNDLFLSIKAPKTANQVLAHVKMVFRWAKKRRIVAIDPCEGIEPNPTTSRDRVLRPEDGEFSLFWKACDQVHPVKAAALKVVLLTGARPGEVCHMRRELISRDGRRWSLPGEPVKELRWPGTKNKVSHKVYLAQPVRELIGLDGGSRQTTGFVFGSSRGNAFGKLGDVMQQISAICNFSPPVTAHDLRRTFATRVTEGGHGTAEEADRLLNHVENPKSNSVRATYDRARYDPLNKPIWEAVAGAIMRMAEGREMEDNVVVASIRP